MKLKNIGSADISVEGVSVKSGETSDNIDDMLARQLVATHAGMLAFAPESEHTAEELEHADEKTVEVVSETEEESTPKKKPEGE